MAKAVLVDITKCIGCGSCTVACKLWNNLDFDEKHPATGLKAELNDNNWTTIALKEVDHKNSKVWRFVKHQCMHCLEPACASACFSKALQKNNDGAVVYYPDLCVGCRYCMIACPFNIPKFEWKKTFPLVTKCQMCSTKIAQGESPACVSVCPTMALKYGERSELLKEAKALINNNKIYVKEIYGETEVGGTAWLYISDIPFAKLGFNTELGKTALPTYTHNFLKYTPFLAIGWGMLLTGLSFYTKRRNEIASKKDNEDQKQQETTNPKP
ncbi:MAG: 4Fe-4S dicluster domain-containing protein [Veillonellaceae bacterium]|jgi:formate dehydrogenase iron-sulfur subunit|nr:4Fe-4S dicluster domain-containing protein [Veillonellaceae bacterium]